jgi:DNA-directed RNA polymerase specialized sigma24 family protein
MAPPPNPPSPEWPQGNYDFLSTQWSVVIRAAQTLSDARAMRAMTGLCETCWYPLYAFARRQGLDAEQARDATQGFFASILEKHGLRGADPAKGRFRSFLIGAMKHYLINEHRAATTQKRGGGALHLSIDDHAAEGRYRLEQADSLTPELTYEKRWAEDLLERVLERLRAECDADGRAGRFAVLEVFLVDSKGAVPYAAAAAQLGISENAAKSAVHRLRERYRTLFREEILLTVNEESEVEDEIRHLLEVLAA